MSAPRTVAVQAPIPRICILTWLNAADGAIAIAGGALCLLGAWLMRPLAPLQPGLGVTVVGAGQ